MLKKTTWYIKIASLLFSLGIGFSIGGLVCEPSFWILLVGILLLIISGLMFVIATGFKKLVFRTEH